MGNELAREAVENGRQALRSMAAEVGRVGRGLEETRDRGC